MYPISRQSWGQPSEWLLSYCRLTGPGAELDFQKFYIKKTLCVARQCFSLSSSCMTFAKHQWNSPAGRNTHSCSRSKPNVSCGTHAIESFRVTRRQLKNKAALLKRPVTSETRTSLAGLSVAYVIRGEKNTMFIALIIWLTQWWHTQIRNDDPFDALFGHIYVNKTFMFNFRRSIHWESLKFLDRCMKALSIFRWEVYFTSP